MSVDRTKTIAAGTYRGDVRSTLTTGINSLPKSVKFYDLRVNCVECRIHRTKRVDLKMHKKSKTKS